MSDLAAICYWIVGLGVGLHAIMLVWFAIGGTRDCVRLLRELETEEADTTDDGRVDSSLWEEHPSKPAGNK